MRFLVRFLLLGTLVAATGSNLFAQRGGAGAGPASSPGRGGGASFGHSSSGGRAYPSFSAPTAGYTGLRSPAAGYTGIRSGALRSRGSSRDYRHVPYGYFFNPYYYPFLDYSSAPYGGSPYDVPDDPDVGAGMMAQNALGDQVQRLSAAVDQLAYNQQAQQGAAYPPQLQPYSQSAPQTAPVMLVLRSGQQIEVQSYAVMDQTFWDFTREPARKIPISNIDVAASTKATEAKGGEFPQLE